MTYHDFTGCKNVWGHAVVSLDEPADDGTRQACIIGPRIRTGDVVLITSNRKRDDGQFGVLQYRVVGDVRTPADPGDQHFLTLSFMERETNEADGRDPR